MNVLVDRDLCEANAVCMAACPEVFEVDETDELVVLDEHPPEHLRDKVRAAVRACPRQALQLKESR